MSLVLVFWLAAVVVAVVIFEVVVDAVVVFFLVVDVGGGGDGDAWAGGGDCLFVLLLVRSLVCLILYVLVEWRCLFVLVARWYVTVLVCLFLVALFLLWLCLFCRYSLHEISLFRP